MSAFRFAAIASLAIEHLPSCQLKTNQQVVNISSSETASGWEITTQGLQSQLSQVQKFDYVINACGFKTGEIDDMIQAKRQRMVEFKALMSHTRPECPRFMGLKFVFYGVVEGTPQGNGRS
eukprot:TRINITY_DN13534_c0_g1_i1.p1 TRINITY_DN13534_c0_g1~~TRINITY_DN13534_c0_g1_i1.p1  ORF type:complete len:133 (-),score=16.55 TRINITY_DN13534_c0_g1_i1:143-505(-)